MDDCSPQVYATGGSQTAGGLPSVCSGQFSGMAGSLGQGGNASTGNYSPFGSGGGGGGGGYYGGGGGAGSNGAGGSSFCDGVTCTSPYYYVASTIGHGSVLLLDG